MVQWCSKEYLLYESLQEFGEILCHVFRGQLNIKTFNIFNK